MCLTVFLIPYYVSMNAGLVILYYYEVGSSLRVFSCIFDSMLSQYERCTVICIVHYYVSYVFSRILIPHYHSVNARLVILYYYEVGSALCVFSRNLDSI